MLCDFKDMPANKQRHRRPLAELPLASATFASFATTDAFLPFASTYYTFNDSLRIFLGVFQESFWSLLGVFRVLGVIYESFTSLLGVF